MRSVALFGVAKLFWRLATTGECKDIARSSGTALGQVLPDSRSLVEWLLDPAQHSERTLSLASHAAFPTLPGLWLVPEPRLALGAQRWLVACLELAPGIHGFVIQDRVAGDVVLIRDRMGELPLCYLADSDVIGVAALPEHLARAFPERVRVDQGRVADVLVDALQWLDLQSTFYRQIRKVPAGSLVCLSQRGIREEVYWRPSCVLGCGPKVRNDADFESAMLTALAAAVQSRTTVEGAGVGSMLSGGLDSSSVAALASSNRAKFGMEPFPVISVLHSTDLGCRESLAIRAGHALPGMQSYILDISDLGRSESHLEALMWDVDEPWDVHNSLLRWIFSTAAEIGLDKVLDGIDADSLFLRGDVVSSQLRAMQIRAAWRNAKGIQAFWQSDASPLREVLHAARRAYGPWLAPMRRAMGLKRRLHTPSADSMSELLARNPIHPDFARRVNVLDRVARYDAVELELGAFDFRGASHGVERYLRAAAPHGVVPSHPFMDVNLVEFCLSLPIEQCVVDGWPKHVLRRAMRGLLPDSIRWRAGKEHLGFQLTQRLVASNSNSLHQRLSKLRDYLDGIVSDRVLDQHCREPISTEPELVQRVELVALAEWIKGRSHLM